MSADRRKFPTVVDAYGQSPGEALATRLVLQGLSTKEILRPTPPDAIGLGGNHPESDGAVARIYEAHSALA